MIALNTPLGSITLQVYGSHAAAIDLSELPSASRMVLAKALQRGVGIAQVQVARHELVVSSKRATSVETLAEVVRECLSELSNLPQTLQAARRHEVAVRYDGPDLAAVAQALSLSIADVVALHTGLAYEVHAIGFQPGFAYLGDLPAALRLPRRASPRVRVPAGSVAIAAHQTAIYPHASPGGWHLLGTTNFAAFDSTLPQLSPFGVGDTVQFLPA